MQRLSFFIVASLTSVFAYFGLSGISTYNEQEPDINAGELLAYDAISDGINTVLYDESGTINYTLRATRQFHFKDQSSELQDPFIRMFRDGKSHWNIVAERGFISPERSTDNLQEGLIELSGNVEIYSLDEFGRRTVLTTESLTIDTAQETMQTDMPVEMSTPNIQHQGEGMFAYLNSDEMQFDRNNRGRYENTTEP